MDDEKSETNHGCPSEEKQSKISEITERIKRAAEGAHASVDLSKLGITDLPSELFELNRISKLCLSNNSLFRIPDELCTRLYQLCWLDIRYNNLTEVPKSIKAMGNLRVLLLDSNKIRTLPIELGFMKKLESLHLRNNPIEFPPKIEVDKGGRNIMRYLRDFFAGHVANYCFIDDQTNAASLLEANDLDHSSCKNRARILDMNALDENDVLIPSVTTIPASNIGMDNTTIATYRKATKRDAVVLSAFNAPNFDHTTLHGTTTSTKSETEKKIHYFGVVSEVAHGCSGTDTNNMCEEHPPTDRVSAVASLPWLNRKSKMYIRTEEKYVKAMNKTKSGGCALALLKTQTERHNSLLPKDLPQPSMNALKMAHKREKKRRSRQSAMILQLRALQKLKDSENLLSWKDDYTRKQKEKQLQFVGKTEEEIRNEAHQRISSAPFDIEKQEMKMLNFADLNAIRSRGLPSPCPPPSLDSELVFQLELASLERDQILSDQVNKHLKHVLERNNLSMPQEKEALHTELISAKQNLDLAIRLHNKVKQRIETLQHFRGSNRRDLW